MTRMDAFRQLEHHAWLGRIFRRLPVADCRFCEEFIQQGAEMDAGAFEAAVQRMFLDKPKRKAWKEIQELLTCANSAAYAAKEGK